MWTRLAVLAALAAPALPSLATAQDAPRRDSVVELAPLTVTATREPREVFRTPAAVSVIDSAALTRHAAASVTDLFADQPGLDLSGVGPSQTRPVIRGQLGQRILLLEDGLRMNNSRRQQDFGEIPALVPLEALGKVEVVRGPASVLYGTDAIAGAVNLITRQPPQGLTGAAVRGSFGYRYQSAGDQQRPWGLARGSVGRFNWLAFGAWRDASSYDAPSGSFGGATLSRRTRVQDTGVRDANLSFQAGYALSETQSVFTRYERYSADDAGFGYVRNGDIQPADPNTPTIKIRYPSQAVDRLSAGYSAKGIGFALADKLDVTGYYVSNARRLTLDVIIPMGPGATGVSSTHNFTDLDTWGFRIEAAKAVAGRHLLTYGFDGFHDHSVNTDTITLTGFGPPPPMVSTTPQLPNATFRGLGAFLQSDLRLLRRLSLIAGVRVQDIRAATLSTPGLAGPLVSHSDQTVVGTLNTGYALTDRLSLVATLGRGFRSPNLVERFFNGPTPEGNGYQRQTPNLRPETSLNVDAGFRYRVRGASLEAFAFQNEVHDGISIRPTGDTVQGLPEYENVNLDRLRYRGIEAAASAVIGAGFSTSANFTVFDSKDVRDPSNPVGQTYGLRVGGTARYEHPGGRFWLAYDVRHNGEQKDIAIASAVGQPVPAFTVMDARAGGRLFRAGRTDHTVTLVVANLTDKLYSEASNTSFFRPAPGRNVIVSYRVDF